MRVLQGVATMVTTVLVASVGVELAGCSPFMATPENENDAATKDVEGGVDEVRPHITSDVDADGADDAAWDVDAGAAGACPAAYPLAVTAEALATDGTLLGESTPLQNFSGNPICNMSAGHCIVRFAPTAEVLDAFAEHRVLDVTLTITRAVTSAECGASCAQQDGILAVNAASSAWDPKTVTFANRQSGVPWAGAGASANGIDIGVPTAQASVSAAATATSIAIAPSAFRSFVPAAALSVRTAFTKTTTLPDGGTSTSRRQFVVVLSSANNTTPNAPPKLTIRYCR